MLVIGEVQTCLLQNSAAATRTEAAELLRLAPGERVRTSERPVPHAVSPELFNGVDCPVPTNSGSRIRGIGTVSARAVITGGRVLQGSVCTRLEPGQFDRRLPWSHYLGRPGVIETIGPFDRDDVLAGFFASKGPDSTLDLGALSERVIAIVQTSPALDHAIPFKSRRTRLRWAARIEDATAAEFVVATDTLRTFSLTLDTDAGPDIVQFCEDLALHDWVLSTVTQLVERSGIGSSDDPRTLAKLRPAIDHLLHLWMPGVLVAEPLRPLWESLERWPGFTKQWQATVSRIRDQIAVHTLELLSRSRTAAPELVENGGGSVGRPR